MRASLRWTLMALTLALCAPTGPARAEQPLKIGYLPHTSMTELRSFGPMIAGLEARLGRKIQMVTGPTYESIIELVRDKEVDIGTLGAFAYVTAQDDFGVKILVRNKEARTGQPPTSAYHSVIFTRVDSNIDALADLKGRTFSFTDNKSTSGFLFPLVAMTRAGVKLEDLGKVVYTQKHPNSVMAVYRGQADAGASGEGPYLEGVGVDTSQMKVIWRSEPIRYMAWVAQKDMPDAEAERIRAAFVDLSNDPASRHVFEEIYVKGFDAATDADYDNVREVLALQKQLEAGGQ